MEHSAENIWNFTYETEELALLSEPIEFDQVFQPLQRYLFELFVRYDMHFNFIKIHFWGLMSYRIVSRTRHGLVFETIRYE